MDKFVVPVSSFSSDLLNPLAFGLSFWSQRKSKQKDSKFFGGRERNRDKKREREKRKERQSVQCMNKHVGGSLEPSPTDVLAAEACRKQLLTRSHFQAI